MNSGDFAAAIYALYPPFRPWDDPTLKAWTNTVVSQCGVFSSDVRAKAFQTLTEQKHKEKPPQVATILHHCKEVKRWQREEDSKGQLAVEREKPKSYDDKKSLADHLVMGPEGRMAAKEGWILGLHNYAHSHGRLPPPSEFGVLRRNATGDDEVYERCVRGVVLDREGNPVLDRNGKPVPMFAAKLLEGLGFKMRQRRRELTDMVQKGERR